MHDETQQVALENVRAKSKSRRYKFNTKWIFLLVDHEILLDDSLGYGVSVKSAGTISYHMTLRQEPVQNDTLVANKKLPSRPARFL